MYVNMYTMKLIHKKKSPRVEIGEPFNQLIAELLTSTNTDNLSPNWNHTDMVRYAIAQLWKKTGKPLPRAAECMLPHFYKDLDL